MPINSNAHFFFKDGNLNIFIPENQKMFHIFDKKYIERIVSIGLSEEKINTENKIDSDLIKNKIIYNDGNNHAINEEWLGDNISVLTHLSSRIRSENYPTQDEDCIASNLLDLSDNLTDVSKRYFPSEYLSSVDLPDPKPELLKMHNFEELLCKRKTSRNFEIFELSLEKLSTLLYYSFGFIHGGNWDEFEENDLISIEARRSSPSSTGLQACDAFLAIFNVSQLTPGYYFYDGKSHKLLLINSDSSYQELSYLVGDQFWSNGLSAGIFIISDLRRIWAKDLSTRGYICSYLDVGHISQTLLLCATSMDIHTWVTGTFRDDELCKKLSINKNYIIPSFFVGLGKGSNQAIPQKIIEKLSDQT
jgi:SagB-type dehydrogenase family enzyme